MKLKRWFDNLVPVQKVALGFAAVILLGGILLTLPISSQSGKSVGFLNALFTSTSSVCVTGLVVVDTGTTFTIFGQTVIMLLIQTGGLGFMTVATLFFMAIRKQINLRERMIIAESLNADSLSGMVRLVKTAATVAFSFEFVGALILMTRFIPQFGWARGIFNGIFHAVSAFNNAGFDTIGNYQNLMPYVKDPVVNFTIMGLIVFGGMGFAVIHELVTRKKKQKLSLHAKIVVCVTATLIIGGTLLFTLMEWNNPGTMANLNPAQKVMAGAFQSVTPRTAGFNTIDQASMNSGSKLLTMMLMFIGASPASTGGGIKTTTFFLILIITLSVIRGSKDINVGHKRLSQDVGRRVGAITVLALGLVIISTMVICMIQPQFSVDSVLFDCFSAFGTVGLSYGITPKMLAIPKILEILLMYCGRVGPLTVSIALARTKRHDDAVRYPEGRIMIG